VNFVDPLLSAVDGSDDRRPLWFGRGLGGFLRRDLGRHVDEGPIVVLTLSVLAVSLSQNCESLVGPKLTKVWLVTLSHNKLCKTEVNESQLLIVKC